MIGSSEPMRRVFALARQIAVYDTTVLITGASGTGKEMVARGIHQLLVAQRRRDGGGGLQRDPGNPIGKRIVRPCQGGPSPGPRPTDVPGLVNLFINRFNNLLGTSIAAASPEAMDLLLSYRWPGNVRELENTIQRALVVSGGRFIEPNHLPQKIQKQAYQSVESGDVQQSHGLSIKKAQRRLEAELIRKALDACGGNKSRASELLEISYPSLLQKIKNYRLS